MSIQPAETFEEVTVRVRDIEGWMTPDQARTLWEKAKAVSKGGRIVEIGSFQGRSMIVLATAADPSVEVIAIDPHAGNDRGPQEFEGFEDHAAVDHDIFNQNLEAAGVADRVNHLRKYSDDALVDVDGEIDLMYIDGAHRYGPAKSDIAAWSEKVRPGGVLLIHDSFSSLGVTAALAVCLFFSKEFRYEGRSQSMTRYRRQPVRGGQRITNALAQLGQLPWFIRNLIIKVLILAKLRPVTKLLGHDPKMSWPH